MYVRGWYGEFNEKIQRLQVSMGILFYLLFWRNILNRNYIEKEITQIIPSHQHLFFSSYLQHS